MRECLFVLSIDTEEEWDWNGPFPTTEVSVNNVQEIPQFQLGLAKLGVKPTYFLDYAVIENKESRECLQRIQENNPDVEFAAHLHPWVTPPKTKIQHEADSHIVNLPLDMVQQQINTLTTAIADNFGTQPKAFRSGRWGINNEILSHLIASGYSVDSSIYPYYKNQWFSCENDSSLPHWISPNQNTPAQKIYELPVTAGFNRTDFKATNELHKTLEKAPWRFFRPIGLLWKLNLVKKIYLSPELSTTNDMIQLCQSALDNDYPVIHMYLHSSSLLPGVSSYVKNKADKTELLDKIQNIVAYLNTQCHLKMCTVTEAATLLMQQTENN